MPGRERTYFLVSATLVAVMAACTHHNDIGMQIGASAGDAPLGIGATDVALLGMAGIDPSDAIMTMGRRQSLAPNWSSTSVCSPIETRSM